MKKDFLALGKYTTCKKDTVYSQKDAYEFIMRSGYEVKIGNLMRQGK